MQTIHTCALCEATSAGTAYVRARSDQKICTYCESELARTQRRRCRKCNGVHAIAEMAANHKGRWCRSCEAADRHQRYLRTADRARAQAAVWHAAHRDQQRERERVYAQTHREATNARLRARYAANPAPVLARCRAYYAAHQDDRKAASAARRAANPEAERLRRARKKLRILRGEA